jgi:TolB-like protein/Tfp pilus assembly protein PilF
MHAGIAAAAGQLGEREVATKAVGDLLRLRPDCSTTIRNTFEKWFDPELREHLIDGLRKAGLEIVDEISEPPDNTHLAASTAFPRFEGRPAIAVLPFVNISNERENEYFCDGLAEELLNALSKIESLQVAARTSAFSFKGKPADISEIGSRLNVSTVLEGSVRQSGNRVRISVQLVNVTDGYHLWSEKYDREMKEIFDIQDEISLAIVEALKLKLLGTEQSVVKRYTDNTEAYQLYLKGRFFVNQRTSASLLKAIDYFNQAITLDSNYPLGYAGLADAYMVLGVPDAVTEALSPRDSLSKARAAAEKALQIDPSVGEIYTTLAHIKWKERDWVGAENDYRRGIELNPHNPIAHFYHAVCLAGLGRCHEAVKEISRAQELDPLSLPVNASVVYVLYLCRRYDEAIEAGKKTLDLDAAFPLTHQRLGLPFTQKQMYREAIAEFEQAVNNSNRAPQPLVSLGHAYAVSGNKAEARKVLAELKDLSQGRYVSPYGVAAIYVGLGEKEQAFEWLEKAFDEDNTELTFLKVDPRLDPLRAEPRFRQLLERAGFPLRTGIG